MPSTPPPSASSPSASTPTLQEMLVHAPFVRAVAHAAVWGDQQVDDVVQATWLAALEKGPQHAGSVKGWLATVTRNVARAMGRGDDRRAARERRAAKPEALDSTAEIVAKEETRRRLVEAVLGLRQPYRSVILLRYYERLSPRAVAARLGIPRETARTQIKRGLKLLREGMDEQHDGDRRTWAVAASGLIHIAGAGGAGAVVGLSAAKLTTAAAVVLVGVLALTHLSGDEPSPGATPAGEPPIVRGPGLALAPTPKQRAGSGTISGTVRLPDGAEGARVDVHFSMRIDELYGAGTMFDIRSPLPTGAPVASVEVGDDGRFKVAGLSDGVYQVWAVARDGFIDVRAAMVLDAVPIQPVQLNLVPGVHRLHGSIRHADGTPFLGVISLAGRQAGMATLGLPEGPAPRETDPEGRFSFEGLRGGSAALVVVQPGIRILRQPLRIPQQGSFDLVLDLGAQVLRGRVVNEIDQGPIPGASVLAFGGGEARFSVQRVAVDSAGRFQVAVEGSRSSLVARAAGFVQGSAQVKDRTQEQILALSPVARIRVSVVSAKDGTPLRDVPVYVSALRRSDGIRMLGGKAPKSNAAGMLTVDTEPGEVMVAAFGAGWMSEALPDVSETFNPLVVSTQSGETTDVRLELVQAARVEGTLRTAADEPVAGVAVTVESQRNRLPRGSMRIPRAHTRSGPDGAYVLNTVWPGTAVRVRVRSAIHGLTESEPFAIKVGEQRTVDVALAVPRHLDVRVLDQDGEPVPSVQVSVCRRSSSGGWNGRPGGVSAEDGSLRLGPLGPRDSHYELRGEGFIEERKPQPLPEAQGGKVATLVVQRGATIAGRVVAPEGMSAVRMEVRLRSHKGTVRTTHSRTQTNASGAFRFEGLPEGTYALSARREWRGDRWQARAIIESGALDAVLSLAAVEPKKTPEARDGWQIRLFAPDGSPVHASWCWRYGDWRTHGPIASVGGGGAEESPLFVARDARLRRMWIEVLRFEDPKKKRLPYAPQLLGPFGKETPSESLKVRLQPGQTIEGRVLGPGGVGVRGTTVSAYAQYPIGVISNESHGTARTDADGRFRLSGLGLFDYELRLALGARHAPVLPVRARAGATDIAIRVRPGIAVTLEVVDHVGTRLARASVSVRLREDLLSGSQSPRGMQRATDSQGRVRLVGLDSSAIYALEIRAPQDAHASLDYKTDEWRPADEVITMPRGYIISGHVRTAAGVPVEGAAVYRQIGPNGFTTAITDSGGAFRFNQISGEIQTLVVTASTRIQPHEKSALRRSLAPGSRDVAFTVDLPPSIELVFPAVGDQAPGLADTWARIMLTETHTAETSAPDRGAAVRRPTWDSCRWKQRHAVRGVLPGSTYAVWVVGGGGVFLARGVHAGDTVSVKPVKGASALVRLRLPGGLPDGLAWHHARVTVSGEGWRAGVSLVDRENGVFKVTGVPESTIRLEATVERWEQDQQSGQRRRVGPRFTGSARVPMSEELELDLIEE